MPEGQTRFDAGEFRRTMGLFTTGVTIITACGADGERVGVTANSFSSVSLDPPLVLWSLAKNARSVDVFTAVEHFAIHILSASQESLSNRFASRGEDKFAQLDVGSGLGGAPLLSGCSARMQCRTVHQYDGGDHIIFVGEVVDLVSSSETPLVFQAGKYALAGRKTNAEPFAASVDPEFRDDFLGYLLWRANFQFATQLRKHVALADLTYAEFLVLATLAHNNWRSPDSLASAIFHSENRDETAAAVAALADKGLLEQREEGGVALVGLNPLGMERGQAVLAAATATESAFLDKLGPWDGAALKNLLRGFIVGTDPGLPHPWERLAHESGEAGLAD